MRLKRILTEELETLRQTTSKSPIDQTLELKKAA